MAAARRTWFSIAALLLAVLPAACAQETPSEDDSSEDELINLSQPAMTRARLDSAIQARQIRSLDQVPAALPKDFLINFTLKHGKLRTGERGHLVERDVSQSSDPLAPRVIMWDERNSFTISYNGGTPGQTAGQRLDIHEFDEATKKFRLTALDFNGTRAPVYQTDAQLPANDKCARCHGPNARPIFSMYPDWPSFYGSDNDELTNMSREVQRIENADYLRFRNAVDAQRLPRYLPLFDRANVTAQLGTSLYPTYPFRQNHSEAGNDISRSFAFRPSLRLGILMNRQMARAAMQQIAAHPNYARYRALFLHDLLECRWPNPQTFQTSGWSAAVSSTLGRAPRMVAGGRTMHYRDLLKLFDLDVRDIDIRYSYNHEGYASDDASRNLMATGYMGDSYWNSYFDGSTTLDELLSMAVYKDLSADPAFSNVRGTITQANGLVHKYQRRVERFRFDENFFRQMDRLGDWIPIPYPHAIIGNVHHREGFPAQFATQHNNLCRALETRLASGPGTSGAGSSSGGSSGGGTVTAGAACAPGCVYSSFCVDRNTSARRYTATNGGQVVCVRSGSCGSECTVQ